MQHRVEGFGTEYAVLGQLPLQSLQVQESALFRLELITPTAAIAAFQFHLD